MRMMLDEKKIQIKLNRAIFGTFTCLTSDLTFGQFDQD